MLIGGVVRLKHIEKLQETCKNKRKRIVASSFRVRTTWYSDVIVGVVVSLQKAHTILETHKYPEDLPK